MNYRTVLCVLGMVLASGCIQDDVLEDYVDPDLRITNPIDSLSVDSVYQVSFRYLDAIGRPTEVTPEWTSDNAAVASVENGRITAHSPGTARIGAHVDDPLARNETPSAAFDLTVVAAPVPVDTTPVEPATGRGTIATTTFYDLTGTFTLAEEEDGLRLTFADDYVADRGLPGLYVFLTNNPNSITGAVKVAAVEVFNGAHDYLIPDVAIEEYRYLLYYCLPFRVKVGDGTIELDD